MLKFLYSALLVHFSLEKLLLSYKLNKVHSSFFHIYEYNKIPKRETYFKIKNYWTH